MYDENVIYGVCLISGKELLVYTVGVNPLSASYLEPEMDCDVKLVKKSAIRLKNKHKKGGQSSVRFGRIADAIRDNEVEEAACDVVEALMYDNHTKCRVKKLIVGGFGPMKDDMVTTSHFKQHLGKYLYKVVTTDDMSGKGACSNFVPLLREMEMQDDAQVDEEIRELLQCNADLLAFGKIECEPLLTDKKLKKLYVCSDEGVAMNLGGGGCVIITGSNLVKSMGKWVGVRLYVEDLMIES